MPRATVASPDWPPEYPVREPYANGRLRVRSTRVAACRHSRQLLLLATPSQPGLAEWLKYLLLTTAETPGLSPKAVQRRKRCYHLAPRGHPLAASWTVPLFLEASTSEDAGVYPHLDYHSPLRLPSSPSRSSLSESSQVDVVLMMSSRTLHPPAATTAEEAARGTQHRPKRRDTTASRSSNTIQARFPNPVPEMAVVMASESGLRNLNSPLAEFQ